MWARLVCKALLHCELHPGSFWLLTQITLLAVRAGCFFFSSLSFSLYFDLWKTPHVPIGTALFSYACVCVHCTHVYNSCLSIPKIKFSCREVNYVTWLHLQINNFCYKPPFSQMSFYFHRACNCDPFTSKFTYDCRFQHNFDIDST